MNSAPYENQQDSQAAGAGYTPPPQAGPYPGPDRLAVTRRKSPALATWLSCMPGLGQVYVGYYQQGFINILVVASSITVLASNMINGLEPFMGVFLAFFWIFNMIDANRRAHHYNRVMQGESGEEVPDGFQVPSAGGSMFGGSVLVILGVLFILDLNFGISLAWIKDWWPLALVAFGLNLIYKARRKAD